MANKMNHAIDITKFIAVIFITNSHYIPLYEDVNTALATLGAHGNALFFFTSGYAITLSKSIVLPFIDWYRNRIKRIWPTFIIWSVLASLVFSKTITWENIVLAKGYWFIQCIMIAYIFLYFIIQYQKNNIRKILIISLLATAFIFILSDKAQGSIFHSNLHWICYFPSMVLGVYLGLNNKANQIHHLKLKVIISFILYFIIMSVGKGKMNYLYYTQIIAILPLNSFIYYLFNWLSSIDLNKLTNTKWLWLPMYWIGSLSLEIYVVQFSIISNKFNHLFPLNTIIIFTFIVLAAYCLRIGINLFNQTFSNDSYSWEKALKI